MIGESKENIFVRGHAWLFIQGIKNPIRGRTNSKGFIEVWTRGTSTICIWLLATIHKHIHIFMYWYIHELIHTYVGLYIDIKILFLLTWFEGGRITISFTLGFMSTLRRLHLPTRDARHTMGYIKKAREKKKYRGKKKFTIGDNWKKKKIFFFYSWNNRVYFS